jgi:sugar lactone lactonase YvrE
VKDETARLLLPTGPGIGIEETSRRKGRPMPRAEQFTPPVTEHGEGAGWDAHAHRLRIVDMLKGDLLTVEDDGSTRRLHVGDVAAAWRPRRGGGVVVGTERGFALLDADGRPEFRTEAWTDPAVRMNDGACDPQGRFYCGSMAYDKQPGAAALWRLDPDRTVTRVLTGLTVSNGLVWSLDGGTAYHIDTPAGRIDAYDADAGTGSLTGRRTVATVSGGHPDGMTIDAEGGLWVAVFGGAAVHRYEPGGALSEVIDVGATNVTSCTLGGPGLRRLFITTSREGVDEPAAGAVFVADAEIAGVPLLDFAG